MQNEPLVFEKEFDAPVELVWRALTEKELMKKWYIDSPDFILEVGAVFHFPGGMDGSYMHICEILEILPMQKLKYTWKYEGYGGISYVTFDLISADNKTTVKLTHEGIETFPDDAIDLVAENFVKGWTALLHTSLKEFLEKG